MPVFNYYTRITSPMTLLPSSPTVRGFTANNLRGSVRYRQRPPPAARAPDRTRLRGNGLLVGSLGGRLGVRGGSFGGTCSSRGARRLARRLACVSLRWMVRGGPGVLPNSSLAALRRRIQFKMGPASYPTARSWRFGGGFEAGPASCLTARSWRFGGWFDTCSAACPTASVYHFDWRRARPLARLLACVSLRRNGQIV